MNVLVAGGAGRGEAVRVALCGMGGVGKTATARTLAERVRDLFPGGEVLTSRTA